MFEQLLAAVNSLADFRFHVVSDVIVTIRNSTWLAATGHQHEYGAAHKQTRQYKDRHADV